MSDSLRFAAFLVIITACVAGCGSKSSGYPQLSPVTGTVTLDGKPLPNVVVTFVNGKGVVSLGATDDTGRYSLAYRGITPGAGLGASTVTVTSIAENPDIGLLEEPIPAIYNAKTTLTADVAAAGNSFDFELSTKPARK
jgi:hypothetical protein